MARLVWDKLGERFFEIGVDQTVLFVMGDNNTYKPGVAWSGVTAINESPSGAESTKHYADNINYLTTTSPEDFDYSIEAFTYPEEWNECNGIAKISKGGTISQQKRKPFALAYRTLIGNDTDGQDHGYKIHIIYNSKAAPSEKNNETLNDSPEPSTMSWDCTTTPIAYPGHKPTAHVVFDSTKEDPAKMKTLEDMIYGTDGDESSATESKLPMPDDLVTMFAEAAG